jgi:hypothetical protein
MPVDVRITSSVRIVRHHDDRFMEVFEKPTSLSACHTCSRPLQVETLRAWTTRFPVAMLFSATVLTIAPCS